jgi:hypothetical protein
MSETNTGGPAFPVCDAARIHNLEGISIRDYFAAKAMQAFTSTEQGQYGAPDAIAFCSYQMADAMLKARNAK